MAEMVKQGQGKMKYQQAQYWRVTLTDGKRFFLLERKSTDNFIIGVEVDKYGDTIEGTGFDERFRIIHREAIKRLVSYRLNLHYGELEKE